MWLAGPNGGPYKILSKVFSYTTECDDGDSGGPVYIDDGDTLDLTEKVGFRPLFRKPFPKLTEFWERLKSVCFINCQNPVYLLKEKNYCQ